MTVVPTKQEAVVKRESMKMGQAGFEFNFEGLWRFAEALVAGEMAPKGMKPGAVMGIIEAGKELGLAPMYALANLTFTNGRLGIMGDAAKALIRSNGVLKEGTDFETVYQGTPYTDDWTCSVSAHRAGQPKPFVATFEFRQAKRAGLVRMFALPSGEMKPQSRERDGWGDKGPWALWTERMMMYRPLGFLCKDYFSDILGGCIVTEELRDYPQTSHSLTPPQEPDPLLAGTIEAEVIDEATSFEPVSAAQNDQKQPLTLAERVETAKGFLRAAKSETSSRKRWENLKSLCDELRDPVAGIDPHLYASLKKVYDECAAKFGSGPIVPEVISSTEPTERLWDLATRARNAFTEGQTLAEANKALESLSEGGCKDFNKLPKYLADTPAFESVLVAAMEGA